ncbi:MAG: DsrE family protein, partial [Candidatus Bathyarchaeia archaeon]
MVKSTVIIITKPPYGHENAYGALYTAIAGQETTLPSTIVLVGDGVYCALKNQTSEDTIRYPSIEKLFHTLSAGTEILVEETSLVERKIPKESII